MAFQGFLRQSTAVDILLGPFLDDTDGKTAETGLTIEDEHVLLSKNGQALAAKNDANDAAHDANGYHNCPLDATDTNTVGQLTITCHVAGALPVRLDYHVVEEAVYDAMYGGSAAGPLQSTTAGRKLDVTSGGCAGIDWANVESPSTAVDLAGTDIQLCDTVTTLTGHTAQTGDTYALAAGATGFAAIYTAVDAILADTGTDGVAVAGISAANLGKLEDILDGTGGTGLTLNKITITADNADGGLYITNAGGPGISANGGDGAVFNGSSGVGLYVYGAEHGLYLYGVTGADLRLANSGDIQDGSENVLLDATIAGRIDATLSDIETNTAEIGVAGAGLTEAGGTGDQFTGLPTVTLADGAHGGAAASITLADYSDFQGAGGGGDATEAKQDLIIAAVITNAAGADIAADIIAAKTVIDTIAGDVANIDGDAMRGTDGANTTVPDAAGTAAGLLALLETHGDSTWATAAGFSTHSAADVVTALGTGSTLTDCLTATGFSTHNAADVVTAMGTGSTLTDCLTATGFSTHDAAAVVTALGTGSTLTDCLTAIGFSTHSAADVVTALGTGSTLTDCLTATGFSTHSAADVVTALGTGSTLTDCATASGFSTHNAADVVTALGTGSTLTDCLTATGFSTLDAADVRTAIGLAAANLDTQLSGISGYVDCLPVTLDGSTFTSLPAVTTDSASRTASKADVSGLATSIALATAQADLDLLTGADGATLATLQPNYAPNTTVPDVAGTVAGLLSSLETHGDSTWATAAGFSTHSAADVVSAIGTGSGLTALASALDLATVDGIVDAILLDTGTALPTTLAAIAAKTDNLPASPAAVGSAMALTSAERNSVATALLDLANAIDGKTLRQAMRYVSAVAAGVLPSGAGSGTETFKGLDGATDRVRVSVDNDGNRTSVEYDP